MNNAERQISAHCVHLLYEYAMRTGTSAFPGWVSLLMDYTELRLIITGNTLSHLLNDHFVNGNNASRMELWFFALLKHFNSVSVQFLFVPIDIVYQPIKKYDWAEAFGISFVIPATVLLGEISNPVKIVDKMYLRGCF